MTFSLKRGDKVEQRQLLADLVALQYRRNDANFARGSFRVRGDTIELLPAHLEDRAWRISLFGDEVESLTEFDPADRRRRPTSSAGQGLRQLALCHAEADAGTGGAGHQGRAEASARRVARCGPPAGGAAARAAHAVRPGDDRGDRLLRRHRELFALAHRPQARRAAADPVRISARQRAGVRRREPRHRRRRSAACSAATTAANRRWPNMASACPPAWTTGRCASRNGTRCGRRPIYVSATPGRLGAGADRRRVRRAGDPAHRPDRPAGRDAPRHDPGRRSDRRDAQGRRARLSRAGHHADQAHGRGSDRIHARAGHPRALHAFRRRDAGAHRDHPRPRGSARSTC